MEARPIIIRCSSLDRLLGCAGSRLLTNKRSDELIDFSETPEGDEMTWRGNWCHYAAASQLIDFHGFSAQNSTLSPPQVPKNWQPDDWDHRSVTWYVNQVAMDTPDDHAGFVEHRFTHVFDRFILTGQLDCHTLNPDLTEFTIEDQKRGQVEVDPADQNWQLAGYAVLLKLKFPTLRKGTLRIRQRAAEVQTTEVEVDDLDTLCAYLEGRINLMLDSWELETGYKQCRLCPCIQFCPALGAEFTAMKMLLTPEVLEKLVVLPNLKDLAEVAARGRAIRGPIDRLLEVLKERVAAEGPVVLDDGTQLRVIEEDGKRVVTEPRKAFYFLQDHLEFLLAPLYPEDQEGLSKAAREVAWKAFGMSLADAEDELVKAGMQRKSIKPGKETAQQWIRDQLGEFIERKPIKKLKFS